MKVSKLLNVFNKNALEIDEKTLQADFAVLRKFISIVFPSEYCKDLTKTEVLFAQEESERMINNIKYSKRRPEHKYTEDYLIYHLHDNAWLTKYLQNIIKGTLKISKDLQTGSAEQSKLKQINAQTIEKFVEIDQEFATARNYFELDLTRAQIKHMMNAKTPNGLLVAPQFDQEYNDFYPRVIYHPMLSRLQKDADKKFRASVIAAMNQLNIEPYVAEIGLEENAGMWRQQLMEDTFSNNYWSRPARDAELNDLIAWHLEASRDNFKENWLKLREYQYYQDHKAIIDELNLVTPNMRLTPKQVETLIAKNRILDEKYQTVVQHMQAQPQNGKEM